MNASTSALSLELALEMVPQLRCFCTSMTSTQHESRTGAPELKTLRLVSKHCKEAITRELHGYSLHLRSLFILSIRHPGEYCAAVQPLSAWEFLSEAQLLRLKIIVQDEEASQIIPGVRVDAFNEVVSR